MTLRSTARHEPLDTDNTPSLEGEAWLMHHNFAQASHGG
jgi:hypothetical protein